MFARSSNRGCTRRVRNVATNRQQWRRACRIAMASDSQSSAQPADAFVYGSLLSRDVLTALLRRTPEMSPGRVRGFRRLCVRDAPYPACVDAAGALEVGGQVLLDLTNDELRVLDEFEDVCYERRVVDVELTGGEHAKANMYVWNDELALLRDEEWSYEAFCLESLEAYVQMCHDFRAELEDRRFFATTTLRGGGAAGEAQ